MSLAVVTWSLKAPAQAVVPMGAGGSIPKPPPRAQAPVSPSDMGAPPDRAGNDDKEPAAKRCKITRDQLAVLVAAFDEEPLPDFDARQALAKRLDLNPRSVQVWFQNRRQRLKPTTKPKHMSAGEAIGGGHCLTQPPPPGFGSARRGGTGVHKLGAIGGGHCLTQPPPPYGVAGAATSMDHTAAQGTALGAPPAAPAAGPIDTLALLSALKHMHAAQGAGGAPAETAVSAVLSEAQAAGALAFSKAPLAAFSPLAAPAPAAPSAPAPADGKDAQGADGLLLLLACAK